MTLVDVTLIDEDTKSILTGDVNKEIPSNMTMHAMIFSKIHILKKFPFVIFIAITIFQNLSFSDIDIFLCRYIININMLNTPEVLAFHY